MRALVKRAPEVERQSKVIIDAVNVIRTLQLEVNAKDKEGHATYREGGLVFNPAEFSAAFVPRGMNLCGLEAVENCAEMIRSNASALQKK